MLGMLGPDVSLEEGWLKSEVKEAFPVIYRLGGPHTDPPPRYRILTVGSCIIQRPGWMRRLVDCYTAVDHPRRLLIAVDYRIVADYRGRLPDGSRIRIRSQRPAVDCRGRLPNISRLLVGSRPP